MEKDDILHFLMTHKSELTQKYSKESDIDIYAVFKEKKFRNVAGAWNYLEQSFGKKVDLFYPHKEMRESLKQSIEKEVVYG